MHIFRFVAAALSATSVLAAPANPSFNTDVATTRDFEDVSDFFNLIARKVHNSQFMSKAPVCDLSKAKMSEAPNPLDPPTQGLTLHHVAVGRGVQNYTCNDPLNSTAAPQAVGAVAVLFNISCLAALHPDIANVIPRASMRFNLTEGQLEDDALSQPMDAQLAPALSLPVSGIHFFNAQGAPFFNLDTPAGNRGKVAVEKDSAVPPPETAAQGQLDEDAIAWLRLNSITEGTEGNIKQVYRLHTAGGSPPATCEGMPESFSVEYAAQYWFWAGDVPNEEPEIEEPQI